MLTLSISQISVSIFSKQLSGLQLLNLIIEINYITNAWNNNQWSDYKNVRLITTEAETRININ